MKGVTTGNMSTYKSLKDHVYEYISDQIFKGNIKPKEKINEAIICEELQVSRTPVREALIQLSDDGILEQVPRRGFIVNEVSINKVEEIYTILGVMEGLAASLAVERMEEDQIEVLENYINEMEEFIKNREFKSYYKLQLKFHEYFIKVSGNSELIRIINSLKRNFIKQTYVIDESNENISEILAQTNKEHKEILKFFKEKDARGIEAYLKEVHWNFTYAVYDSI